IAAALVLAMFGLSGVSVAFAARFGPSAVMAAALGGFMLRLVAYALLIVLLRPVEAIHGPSLAISAAVLLIATLVCEAWLVITRPGFFWVDTSARPAGHIERKMA
ncbi:MAG TPA: hypothetical protein VML96_08090, partial [Egibacteraceae bacterium]|nr:hypothetical protein [Egibacteraceae bacterium]